MAIAGAKKEDVADSFLFALNATVGGVTKDQETAHATELLQVQQWLERYGWNGSPETRLLTKGARITDSSKHTRLEDLVCTFPLNGQQLDTLRASIIRDEKLAALQKSNGTEHQSRNQSGTKVVLPRPDRKVTVHDSHKRSIWSSRILEVILICLVIINFVSAIRLYGTPAAGLAFLSFVAAALAFAAWVRHHQLLGWHGEWLHRLAPGKISVQPDAEHIGGRA